MPLVYPGRCQCLVKCHGKWMRWERIGLCHALRFIPVNQGPQYLEGQYTLALPA